MIVLSGPCPEVVGLLGPEQTLRMSARDTSWSYSRVPISVPSGLYALSKMVLLFSQEECKLSNMVDGDVVRLQFIGDVSRENLLLSCCSLSTDLLQ